MSDKPQGAVVEIIEKGPALHKDEVEILVPNEVRINGQQLLCSSDDPVIVHEVSTGGDEAVRVTLTLFAKRVRYDYEGRDGTDG